MIIGIDPGTVHTGISAIWNTAHITKIVNIDSVDLAGKIRVCVVANSVFDSIMLLQKMRNKGEELIVVFEDYALTGRLFNVEVAELVGILFYRLREAILCDLKIAFLPPTMVKKLITGDGKSSKKEVADSLKEYTFQGSTHETDAIGIMLCYKNYLEGKYSEEVNRKIKGRTYLL